MTKILYVTFGFSWSETDIDNAPGRTRDEKIAALLRDYINTSSDDETAMHIDVITNSAK